MSLPDKWQGYLDQWSDQLKDCDHVTAQILIGSDQAILHPLDVLDQSGLPVETETARLKRSKLTNKYLAHGHNNAKIHFSHDTKDVMTTVQNHSNEKDRYNHHTVTIEDVSDQDDLPSQQTCSVQVHTAGVPSGPSHVHAIELHPDQSNINCDEHQVYTLLLNSVKVNMMRFAQCTISTDQINQSNILDPVYIDFNEQNNAKPCHTFQHPDDDVIFHIHILQQNLINLV